MELNAATPTLNPGWRTLQCFAGVGHRLHRNRGFRRTRHFAGWRARNELTQIITFQRGYEASAKIISTADQLMQDTLAMKQ